MTEYDHKYSIIKQYVIDYIKNNNLKKGDGIFSEKEVMERFKVSRHTVRRSYSELINEGWLYSVKGQGTFVNDPDAYLKKPSKLVGVVTTYMSDYIFPDIISGMEDVLSKNGYNMLLANTNNEVQKERICLINLLGQNLLGLIIEPTQSALPATNLDILAEFQRRKIPIIFIHSVYDEIDASYIVEDDEYGGYIATKHLIENNQKKILGIFKIDDQQGHNRYKGFVKAHRESNLEIEAVVWFSTKDIQKFSNNEKESSYRRIVLEYLEKVNGIVCYNDQIAIQVLGIMQERRIKIPEQCSLVSFDDSKLSVLSDVKLTTVAHPKSILGKKAALMLFDIMNTNQSFQKVIRPSLMVRRSSFS